MGGISTWKVSATPPGVYRTVGMKPSASKNGAHDPYREVTVLYPGPMCEEPDDRIARGSVNVFAYTRATMSLIEYRKKRNA